MCGIASCPLLPLPLFLPCHSSYPATFLRCLPSYAVSFLPCYPSDAAPFYAAFPLTLYPSYHAILLMLPPFWCPLPATFFRCLPFFRYHSSDALYLYPLRSFYLFWVQFTSPHLTSVACSSGSPDKSDHRQTWNVDKNGSPTNSVGWKIYLL